MSETSKKLPKKRTASRRRRLLACATAACAAVLVVLGMAFAPIWPDATKSGEGAPDQAQNSSVVPPSDQGASEANADAIGDPAAYQDGSMLIDANEGAPANFEDAAPAQHLQEYSYPVVVDEGTGATYVADEVMLGLAEGVTAEQVNAQLAQLDYVATKTVSEEDVVFGYVRLDLAQGVTVEDASARLEQLDIAQAAQPNYVYHLLDDGVSQLAGGEALQAATVDLTTQGEPSAQEGLSAQSTSINDPYASQQWALQAINAYQAWDYVKCNGKVTVAILDSGLNTSHEDFKDASGASAIVAPWSILNNSSTVTDKYQSHGTHVAGIVAAAANNGKGVAGVSYNAKIMPVQIIDSYGNTSTEHLSAGLEYVLKHAASHNVRVVNLSLGGPMNSISSSNDRLALTALSKVENADILIIAAAGNGANNTQTSSSSTYSKGDYAYKCFPVDFDSNLLGVINLTKNSNGTYERAAGSNFNIAGTKTKDIGAPGSSIYSTFASSTSSYGSKSGTSMATPCVSGVAALLFAADSSLSAADVKKAICDSAQDLGAAGFDLDTGYGMVDAREALFKAVPRLRVTMNSTASVTYGDTVALVIDNNQSDMNWTWQSSDPAVVKVSSTGNGEANITGFKKGVATVTATSSDITLTCLVTVNAAPISKATATAASQVYTGQAFTPNPTVVYNGAKLVKGTDYTVGSYSNNVNAGTASFIVTGTGNFTGTLKGTFTINPASLSSAVVSGVVAKTYTGLALTQPLMQVTLGSKTLKQNTDYTVTYANNVQVGTATVKIVGKGSYAGTLTKTFQILPKPSWSGASVIPVGAQATYTVTNGSLKVLSGGTGQVALSGKTLTGKKAGTVKLALCNSAGQQYATKVVTVFALSGPYYVRSSMNSNLLFDISGASTSNGGDMIVWKKNDGANQKFTFELRSDGYFLMRSAKSGKLVDVSGASKANGANVLQWVSNNGANQQWRITVDASNRLSFVNRNSGKLLDVSGGSAANGTTVIQWPSNGGLNQKWTLAAAPTNNIGPVYEGTYRIAPASNTGLALDVSGASRSNGANVALWTNNGQANQKFTLIYVGNGLYRIQSVNSGLLLDASGGAWKNGVNVLQWASNGGNNQLWKPVRNSDGTYTFYRNGNAKWALNISGSVRSGANVNQWSASGLANQKFRLYQY